MSQITQPTNQDTADIYGQRVYQYKLFRDDVDELKKLLKLHLVQTTLYDILNELNAARCKTTELNNNLSSRIRYKEVLVNGHPEAPKENQHHSDIKHGNLLDAAFKVYHQSKEQIMKEQNDLGMDMHLNQAISTLSDNPDYNTLVSQLNTLSVNEHRQYHARQLVLWYIIQFGLRSGAFLDNENYLLTKIEREKYVSALSHLLVTYPDLTVLYILYKSNFFHKEPESSYYGLSYIDAKYLFVHISNVMDELLKAHAEYYHTTNLSAKDRALSFATLTEIQSTVTTALHHKETLPPVWERTMTAKDYWKELIGEIAKSIFWAAYDRDGCTIGKIIRGELIITKPTKGEPDA